MAREAGDWLTRQRMKAELRLPDQVGAETDKAIDGHITEALGFLIEYTDLPIIDRSRFVEAYPAVPILIADRRDEHVLGIPYLKTVDAITARLSPDRPFDVDVPLGAAPVLEAASSARSPTYRFWPDTALPAGADRIRVSLTVGMDEEAVEHGAVRSALILIVRDLWDGLSLAERRPAWERMIEQKVLGSGGAS